MVIIVKFYGGLGNQMFSYAFYLALKNKFKFSIFFIEPVDCFNSSNGYELPYVFNKVKHKRAYKYYRRIQKIYSIYFTKSYFKSIKEDQLCNFLPEYSENHYPFLVYDGFWQTELYFLSIANKVRKLFQFNENQLNIITKQIKESITNEQSVSIHIRRGDYLETDLFAGTCPIEYYKKAVEYMNHKFKNCRYYLFSNDPQWVKENISFFDYTLVDCNNGLESWQDMFLMTLCKHNIIANSTFSWWGAWLNKNLKKIVIAPSIWFNGINAKDIIPIEWVRI